MSEAVQNWYTRYNWGIASEVFGDGIEFQASSSEVNFRPIANFFVTGVLAYDVFLRNNILLERKMQFVYDLLPLSAKAFI